MSIVILVSGGLNSTLVAKLAQEEGADVYPLFIDYGQRTRDLELTACKLAMKKLGLPEPQVAPLEGFGKLIRSGLTDDTLDIVEDAFTPGRNMLLLLTAAAYAYQKNADAVSIGLLHESASRFPDQTSRFLIQAEDLISLCMGRSVTILSPLETLTSQDVAELAKSKGLWVQP